MATKRKRAARKRTSGQRESGVHEHPEDIQTLFNEVQSADGEQSIITARGIKEVNRIPTGCFILDFALLGGWPEGYPSMLFGYHSTAKTTAFLRGAANLQRKYPDKYVVWCDAEKMMEAMGDGWLQSLGLNLDRLIILKPRTGERGVDQMEAAIRKGSVAAVILDSIPAMVPMKVAENSAEDDTMGALPRLMGKFCSAWLVAQCERPAGSGPVSLWLVNQIREKCGFVMGSPNYEPGGKQINHIATTKIWFKLKKEHTETNDLGFEVPSYNEQNFQVKKSKHGPSIKTGDFDIVLGHKHPSGIPIGQFDNTSTIRAFGVKMGFIGGGGGNYKLLTQDTDGGRFKKFRTHKDIEAYLDDNEEEKSTLARSILARQRVASGLTPLPRDGYLWNNVGRLVTVSDE